MTKRRRCAAVSVSRVVDTAVEVAGVVVKYPTFTLGPIDLEINAGEIVCLVGPNGAGKTTLLRALIGLLPLESGHVLLGGENVQGRAPSVVKRIGWIPDDDTELLEDLTCSELWDLHAYAHSHAGAERKSLLEHAQSIAAQLDFDPPKILLASCSHGMRKKAQIVTALMHEPRLLLLDEPRNGLDPIAIDRLEQLITGARDMGRAIVISTHDLHYAQRVADRVVVMSRGTVRAMGTPTSLMTECDSSLHDAFMRLIAPEWND